MVELRQLEHFLAVAHEGTFTRAAARLLISQPGLSSSIKALEHELGDPLFVRHGRRVELTDSGQALYSGARRTLAALEATKAEVHANRRGARRTLRVGSIASFAGLDLAALISKFTAQNPRVVAAVTVSTPVELFDKVRNDELDLAFVTMPQRPLDGLQFHPLETFPMVLACPLGHHLAEQPDVRLAMLANEVFVDFDPVLVAREVNDQAFQAAGIDRRIRATCNEIGSLLELVAHGLGVAIVPRHLALASRVPVKLVRLTGTSMIWTVAVVTRAGGFRNPDAQTMWNDINATARPIRDPPP
jgi:DNA-binding transcriptional LysR family regulator